MAIQPSPVEAAIQIRFHESNRIESGMALASHNIRLPRRSKAAFASPGHGTRFAPLSIARFIPSNNSMRWLIALGVTAGLVAITVAFAFTRYDFLSLVVILETAFLVAVDSSRLELNRYQVPIRVSPPMAVFGNVLTLAPIYLPFYLVVRSRRVAGELKLKEKYRGEIQTPADGLET